MIANYAIFVDAASLCKMLIHRLPLSKIRIDQPVDQLIDFPLAPHDDGPDGLEMAVRLPLDVEGGIAA